MGGHTFFGLHLAPGPLCGIYVSVYSLAFLGYIAMFMLRKWGYFLIASLFVSGFFDVAVSGFAEQEVLSLLGQTAFFLLLSCLTFARWRDFT